MIIKCDENHLNQLVEFANQDKIMNLFIIGNITNYGLDYNNLNFFIDISENNKIRTLYANFRRFLTIFSPEGYLDNDFVKKLVLDYDLESINGDYNIVKNLNINNFKMKKTTIATLEKLNNLCDFSEALILKEEDITDYVEGCRQSFDTPSNSSNFVKDFREGKNHFYGYKIDSKLISGAMTVCEIDEAAMVIGVYTLPNYRKQHYALKTVSKLCDDMLKKGKTGCLFFNNPKAAELYHKIGFKDYGYFGLLQK